VVNRERSETRSRSQLVGVRLSPDEHERFTALAATLGRSLPDTMRLAMEAALIQEAIQDVR